MKFWDYLPIVSQRVYMELKWLFRDLTDPELQEILNYELPSEALDHWPVHTIRSPK